MDERLNIFVSHPSDLITDCRAHGDGLIAYELISRLAGRGHRLHVAYTSCETSAQFPDNVILHRVVCRFPSSIVQEIEYMFLVRQLFWRLHRKRPFDLIHQFHPVFAGRSALLVNTNIPLVLGVFYAPWSIEPEKVPLRKPWRSRVAAAAFKWIIQLAHRRQLRKADVWLLSTPSALPELACRKSQDPQIVLLWCPGVDTDYYTPDARSTSTGPSTVLFLGNLETRKGIFTLAKAFRTVWRSRPDVRLVYVGNGSQRAVLQRFVNEDESKINVEFCGELKGDPKRNALRATDLVVMPSFGEPFGLVALEAMACAKPVLATRAGGLQHLISPEGGRLVPIGDALRLAEEILDLLAQPEQLSSMGSFNRRFTEERFAWPKVIDRLEAVYYSQVKDV